VLPVVPGIDTTPVLTAPMLSESDVLPVDSVLSGVPLILEGTGVVLLTVTVLVTSLEVALYGGGSLFSVVVEQSSVEVDELVVQGSVEVDFFAVVVVQVSVALDGRGWLVML
jgi:hypothetical protein